MGIREKLPKWNLGSRFRTPSPSANPASTELAAAPPQELNIPSHNGASLAVSIPLPPTISVTSPTPITSLQPPIPPPAERESTYGLLSLSLPLPELPPATSSAPTFPIDIVAVHGLRGDAYSTWTHPETKYFWLRDSLPKELPGARIYTFGYDAGIFSRETGDFDDYARELLLALSQVRTNRELQRRPIVFICHSMGGIVVKRALNVTKIEEDQFADIREQTKAILFMATPHSGSGSATLGKIAADILKLPLPRGVLNPRSDLIKSLERDSKGLVNISTEFRFFTKTIKFYSFIEKSIMQFYGRVIVNDTSGRLNAPSEQFIMMNGCDHQSICRFEGEASRSYGLVMGVLQKVGEELTTLVTKIISDEDKPCLDSLSFSSMNDRFMQTNNAHPSTCKWILSQPIFLSWQSSKRGLLWIKGKPGTGKSTLLAFLYSHFKSLPTHSQDICLDFFFYGTGTTLQKSPIGMLRSLLHQLYRQSLFARAVILDLFKDKKTDFGENWQWQIDELQVLFSDIICKLPKSQEVLIFVDALDEAMDERGRTAGKLLSYFHALNDRINEVGGSTRICISCRHYPVVATRAGLEICMENENQDDISKYVRWHLESGVEWWMKKEDAVQHDLENAIVQKAEGVFLWVYWRIPKVIEDLNNGFQSITNIRQLLEGESNELFPVYQNILMQVKNLAKPLKQQALLLIQWVCFAERPLTPVELRLAIACDSSYITTQQRRCEDSGGFIDDNERMGRLTKSLSGGLAEVRHHEDRSTVQLFHQSVKDFFLECGLQMLLWICEPSRSLSNEECYGESETRLSRSCINYLMMGDILEAAAVTVERLEEDFLFLSYATDFWLVHAERAESHGTSQTDIVNIFEVCPKAFDAWKDIHYAMSLKRKYSPERFDSSGTALIHVAAHANLQSVCHILIQKGVSVDEPDTYDWTPLQYAARWGHMRMAESLIALGANVEARFSGDGTALSLAGSFGHESVVTLLLKSGTDINRKTGKTGTVLTAACASGNIALVKTLIKNGADVHIEGGTHGSALIAASEWGHEQVARILLASGADVNFQGGYWGSALNAAIESPYPRRVKMTELLLEAGADVNLVGGYYGTALQAAMSTPGSEILVPLLLKYQPDLNLVGGYYGTILQAASSRFGKNEEKIEYVKMFLGLGANVNAEGGYYGTALQAAATENSVDLVRILLDAGADPNIRGGHYGSAIQAAAQSLTHEVVLLLLERGAILDERGGFYGNLLQASAAGGNEETAKWLLAHGFDINEKGGWHGSVLQAATRKCLRKFIAFLLDSGANINAVGGDKGTAIRAAIYWQRKNIVELLVERGANVNEGGGYTSPVQLAAELGNAEILGTLLEGGKIDMFGEWYDQVLQDSRRRGHKEVVSLLEEKRVPVANSPSTIITL